MSILDGRIVLIARLHSPIHIFGFGNLGPVIDQNSVKGGSKLTMVKITEGVLVTGLDANTKNQFEVVIPQGNLQSIQLQPEE